MGNKNLYIPAAQEQLVAELERILKERGSSLSEFFMSSAKSFVEANSAGVEDIVLESPGLTRKFKGRYLWSDNHNADMDAHVILTKRGRLVYWCEVPAAINPDERYTYRVFDNLHELEEAELLDEEALAEVAAEMGEQIVQELDI